AAPGLVPLAAAERAADLPRFPAASSAPAGDVGVPVPADLSTEAGPVPVAVFFAVRLGGEPADVFADAVFFAFPVAAFLVAAVGPVPFAAFLAEAFFRAWLVAVPGDFATLLVAFDPLVLAVFLAAFFAGAAFAVLAVEVALRDFVPAPWPSASRSPASKRARMSAISSTLSLLRWLATPLVPRLLPVSAREESFCRRTRSRARSRAARARVMRVEI